MTQSNSGSQAATRGGEAGGAVADRFAVDISAAFPGEEESHRVSVRMAEPPVDDGLLRIVPAPKTMDFDALEREATGQRRIVVRGKAGIPIAGVISVGGSLLIHGLLIGAFVLCFYFALHAPPGGGGMSAGDVEIGGSSGGSLFVDEGPVGPAAVKGSAANAPVTAAPRVAAVSPIAPPKPPLVQPKQISPQIAMNPVAIPPLDPEIIGIPSAAEELGTVHALSPARAAVSPPEEVGLPITAPPQAPVLTSPIRGNAHDGAALASGASQAGSARPGLYDDGGDDGDGVISLMNHGHGDGGGGGNQRGNGIDRGMFGGGDLSVKVRDLPTPHYSGPPVNSPVVLRVVIHADGAVGTITVQQSSGNADYDEACKESVRHGQYTPARVNGRYVEGFQDITMGQTPK